jgi:hypothetical protein
VCGPAVSEHGNEVAYVGHWTILPGTVGGATNEDFRFLGTTIRDDAVLDIAVGGDAEVLAVSASEDASIPGADGETRDIGIDIGVLATSATDDVGYPMSLVEGTRDTGIVGIAQVDLAVGVGGKPRDMDTALGIAETCRVTHVECADSLATPWATHGEVTESEQQQAAPAGMETWRFTPPT